MIIQSQVPIQRPVTTAHLAQTMSLMSLTIEELRQKIDAELSDNPALELIEERYCPSCGRSIYEAGPCPICSHPKDIASEEPIVFVSPREDFFSPRGNLSPNELPDEEIAPELEDLPTYVMRQIAPDMEIDDLRLAAHILTSLDEDGLLRLPIIEIARYHHVPSSRVEKVVQVIQRADPIGVGSTSPQEALLVQLETLSEICSTPPLATRAIQYGLDLLSRHQYAELGRLLGTTTAQAKEIANFISENLNPYPGRAHWGNPHLKSRSSADIYHLPDIIVSSLTDDSDSPFVIEIVSPIAGKLQVNPLFRSARQEAPPDKADEWQNDIERASLFVKCLQQRNHTIVRLMERLAVIQRNFLLKGDAYLEPTTRANLADKLDVHESTISRAVSGKAVQLPNGRIIPLARLFDRSLHIRTVLRQIIAQETEPLTDTQLVDLLEEKGHRVARRTVAKYRSMEGILPAHLRTLPQTQP